LKQRGRDIDTAETDHGEREQQLRYRQWEGHKIPHRLQVSVAVQNEQNAAVPKHT
jgi:hypothetical protein